MEKEEYIAIEGMQVIVKGRKRFSIGNLHCQEHACTSCKSAWGNISERTPHATCPPLILCLFF